jgi:two-component system response regulator NreC
LRKILEEQPEWVVIDEASDGREVVNKALQSRCGVVVIDVSMPSLNGIEAIRQIARRAPNVRLLVVSMHADEAFVAQAVEAGAHGYLLKDSAGTDLVQAVRAVSQGQSFFSPSVTNLMIDGYRRRLTKPRAAGRYESLTDREREVFQLAAEGRSNKDVADVLCLSVATVETHRAHILQKLGVHNTAGLVLFAVRQGLVS